MNLNSGNPVTCKVAGELHQLFEETTQRAMLHVDHHGNGNAGDTTYIGLMAALAPVMLTAGILAKTPDWAKAKGKNPDDYTAEDVRKIAGEVVTPETVMFAALATAYVMQSFDHKGNLQAGFGAPTLWQALEAWTKIFPGLKADNYFDANMLQAARKAGTEVEQPFADFLQGRITHNNSPGSLN